MDASDSKLHSAKALQLRGRVAEAEALYREVLRDRPDEAHALEGLGVLVFQQGRAAEAAELFARGVSVVPESARFHANLGEALRSTDRAGEALPHLRRAIELDATLPHAWNSLALLAHSEGRFADAEASCREAIRLTPRLTAAYINLGNALSAQGREAEAAEALRAGLRIEPHNPLTLMNLAWSLCEHGDPACLVEAEALCRRALALAPQVPNAHKILGNILRLAGRHDEARAAFAGAAGTLAQRAGTAAEASRSQRAGLAEHARGMAQLQQGQLELAEASFREALALEPKLAAAWNGLARIQAERGDLEASCQDCKSAIAADENQAEAYWRLATNLHGQLSDEEQRAMEQLLSHASLSNDDRALLCFGLAGALERRGRFELAAARLSQAHAYQSAAKAARSLAYDPDVYSRLIDKIIQVFKADFVAGRRGCGIGDRRPVFVVGLPRSGTTLAEQIIASHSKVQGAGELAEIERIFYSLPAMTNQPALDAWTVVRGLEPAAALAAAQQYLDRLATLAPASALRVVDKNPLNVHWLGLISLLWPAARVIWCRRDLRDVAVSCWRTTLPQVPWNNNPDHIARLFADHERLAAHWNDTRPLQWFELQYEQLVADPEAQSRRLIEFLDLEWDPGCLNPHLNRRVVRTPSLVQVRQKVHTRSAGIWRNYEPYLRPLFEALERHEVRVG